MSKGGRSKNRSKRSASSLPRGLPVRKKLKGVAAGGGGADSNPFESARSRPSSRSKFAVHNRRVPGSTTPSPTSSSSSRPNFRPSATARSLSRRKASLREELKRRFKSNEFVDRRIGEYGSDEDDDDGGRGGGREERMLARVVRERARRSRKLSKFSLEEDDDENGGGGGLTHGGRSIDDLDLSSDGPRSADDVVLSSDDEDGGQLDRADTEMHFGGGSFDRRRNDGRKRGVNPYGPSGDDGGPKKSLGDAYRSRKEELDDLIARSKTRKAERAKRKEEQSSAFDAMDESFRELASLLNFRDKEKERREREKARKEGTVGKGEKEMDDWDRETKEYLFERKVKATDRTKTPEELAKEEADRLRELEARRVARMNGVFDGDDLSDVDAGSDEEGADGRGTARNPDELDDSDDEDGGKDGEPEARFTADGIVYVDKDGKVFEGVDEEDNDEAASDDGEGEEGESSSDEESGSSDDEEDSSSDDDDDDDSEDGREGVVLTVGSKVEGNYRADEQFENRPAWYAGTITKVHKTSDGKVAYDVTYDDGDFEEGMKSKNVRVSTTNKTEEEKSKEEMERTERKVAERKRRKAKEMARESMPYALEAPTTLDALHSLIAKHASTGKDASLLIDRIFASNSVKSDSTNRERMQNFHDVLLRRFVAVGDAIYKSGDGGKELGRYDQLDRLTVALYRMAHDDPETAGAVWGRRLGIWRNAFAKRLRDATFVGPPEEEEEGEGEAFTVWPSTGTILLLRALGKIFPVTDLRHPVVTPALLLLGQYLALAPVRSISDLTRGVFCAGLLLEYTWEARRIAPEALAFLSGTARLFAWGGDNGVGTSVSDDDGPTPSLSIDAVGDVSSLSNLRRTASKYVDPSPKKTNSFPSLSLERYRIEGDPAAAATAVLCASLRLVARTASKFEGSIVAAEAAPEIFAEASRSLLLLGDSRRSKRLPALPSAAVDAIAEAAAAVSRATMTTTRPDAKRAPLARRAGKSKAELAVKSLAPRMEDPDRYAMTKKRAMNKSAAKAESDRLRREYKRERKAASRELRHDAAFVEAERRSEKERRDGKARERRQKNFAWLEREQATMNAQVRMGGGLLTGGGTGAARAKVATAKLGVKRGGKMRG